MSRGELRCTKADLAMAHSQDGNEGFGHNLVPTTKRISLIRKTPRLQAQEREGVLLDCFCHLGQDVRRH